MVRGKGSHGPASVLLVLCAVAVAGCKGGPKPGEVLDEAKAAGRTAQSFPAADEDYFRQMDGGVALTSDEVKGRNTWIVWSGGNDRFWDTLSHTSVGTLDFLKTLSSHPKLKFSRDNRWYYLGLVNEPCFEKATGPDPERFGLWLDKRRVDADCPPDPFENEQKYPGVAIGARGKNLPVGSYYGYATGIVGLRLFPNPDFDEAAAKKWDPERYYKDPNYYLDKNLIKPYRVGMSCGFCHVGPNPIKPPADPENPKWENLSSNVGAQYFWVDRIFVWDADHSSFVYQLFHTSRPGALDTSFVSTDNINNPRTMNAVYALAARMQQAQALGQGDDRRRRARQQAVQGLLQGRAAARILPGARHGLDAARAQGRLRFGRRAGRAQPRLPEHRPVQRRVAAALQRAGRRQAHLADRDRRRAEELGVLAGDRAADARTPACSSSIQGHRAAQAEGRAGRRAVPDQGQGSAHARQGRLRARTARAATPAKLPEPAPGVDPGGQAGKDYLRRLQALLGLDQDRRVQGEDAADRPGRRFPRRQLPLHRAAHPRDAAEDQRVQPARHQRIGGNIWDNFSSQSYKDLPSVGKITVHNPITGEPRIYTMPAGGRGYTRPASLVSLWSTAPFLLNNQVGQFDPSPSVEARMRSFNDSIEKMLWPEKREKDAKLGDKVPGLIDRTTADELPAGAGRLPARHAAGSARTAAALLAVAVRDSGIEIGPIPAGTPVNLLSNVTLVSDSTDAGAKLEHKKKLVAFLLKAKAISRRCPRTPATRMPSGCLPTS